MTLTAFYTPDTRLQPQLRRLAEYWRLPWIQTVPSDHHGVFLLRVSDCTHAPGYRIDLAAAEPGMAPLTIDFDSARLAYRISRGGGRRQALARALGLGSARSAPRLLDLTAGLGQDAFVAAALGARVTMVERHPAIAALLDNALERAKDALRERPGQMQQAVHRLTLAHADAVEYIARPAICAMTDVVYLDPMYPQQDRSARVKKGMALLQQLLGDEADNSRRLLQAALAGSIRRIVLKRPKTAPVIGTPVGQVRSRTTRFDLYTGTGRTQL